MNKPLKCSVMKLADRSRTGKARQINLYISATRQFNIKTSIQFKLETGQFNIKTFKHLNDTKNSQ